MRETKNIRIIKLLILGIAGWILTVIMAMTVFATGKLEVHFIDVGQGDAMFIECDGENMVIDGGPPEASSRLYSYLKNQGVTSLKYIVNTHGDSDHVGGLPGAVQLVGSNIGTAFAPYKDLDKERFRMFVRKLDEVGKEITVPKAGDKYSLGGATFQILSAGGAGDNESIMLRLSYGDTSFLFTGDASDDQERSVINSGYVLESDVLKVGHHGSKNSSCYQFLRAVYPKTAVICVGAGNAYGHPTEETLSRLRDEGATVYRTDNNGTIVMSSAGKTITVVTKKESSQEKNLIPGGGTVSLIKKTADETSVAKSGGAVQSYILNINTKKFHYPSCRSVSQMKEKNKKEVTDTRENIIAQGYDPCGNCHP